jgi:hypothetical protein
VRLAVGDAGARRDLSPAEGDDGVGFIVLYRHFHNTILDPN